MKYFFKIFLCIFIPLLFVECLFKILSFNTYGFEFIRIILYTLQFSLLLSILLSFLRPLANKIIICIVTFVSGFYALLQLAFKSFMGNYMSLGMLKAGDATRVSDEFWPFVMSIKPIFYLCLLPFIVLIVIFCLKKINYEKINWKKYLILVGVFIVVTISSVLSLQVISIILFISSFLYISA